MSPSLRAEAAAYLRSDRVTVIHEPILTDLPQMRRRPGTATRLVFAGRLVAQKNVALALRTMAALPDDISLTIVGDGPDRGRLEAMARHLRLADRVTFTGLVPDIRPYLEASDLFLLPSHFEGCIGPGFLEAGKLTYSEECMEIIWDQCGGKDRKKSIIVTLRVEGEMPDIKNCRKYAG